MLLITIDVQIAVAQQGFGNCSDPGVNLRHAQTGKGTACGLVWWRREVTGLHVKPTGNLGVPIGILKQAGSVPSVISAICIQSSSYRVSRKIGFRWL